MKICVRKFWRSVMVAQMRLNCVFIPRLAAKMKIPAKLFPAQKLRLRVLVSEGKRRKCVDAIPRTGEPGQPRGKDFAGGP
jgi:hypothetical protein